MPNKIYFNDWCQQYQPITGEDGEPQRLELSDLAAYPNKYHRWTELSYANDVIVPGVRLVDAFAYFITAKPWADEDYHTLEVTELITRDDYLEAIEYYRDGGDEESADLLQEQMNEEFPDAT